MQEDERYCGIKEAQRQGDQDCSGMWGGAIGSHIRGGT